jgi:hypothetical protein
VKDRSLIATWAGGFVLVSVAARLLRDDVGGFQSWAAKAPLEIALCAVAAGTLFAFARWGRQGDAERRAFTMAILANSTWILGVQAIAPYAGWWGGVAMQPPIPLQVALYGVSLIAVVALFLGLYASGSRRRRSLGLGIAAATVISMAMATVAGDRTLLARGTLVFDNGYTVASDVIYAVAMFSLPPLVYEIARRAARGRAKR